MATANTFTVQDTLVMYLFLKVIGPKNRANITRLIVKGWCYCEAQKPLNNLARAGEGKPEVTAAEDRETSTTEILEKQSQDQRKEKEEGIEGSQISLSPNEAPNQVIN